MLFELPVVSWSAASVVPGMVAKIAPDLVTSLALLAALAYAVWSARVSGLNPRAMYWAVVCSLLGGLWGAHLLSLLVHGWGGGPWALVQFIPGSKSLFGGLVVGGFVAGFYFHFRKLPVLAYADAAMPALALGYAIGRIGCFLNGDDYGTLSRLPWAVTYPSGTEAYEAHLARGWIPSNASASLPSHPVQLYASLVGMGLFVLLACWRPARQGRRFCAYLIVYGMTRFVLEWLRGDFHPVVGVFSLPQLFSGLFIIGGVGLWFTRSGASNLTASFNRRARKPFLTYTLGRCSTTQPNFPRPISGSQ